MTPPKPRENSSRLFNIQALRGIAAMLVAYSHCSTFYLNRVDLSGYSRSATEGVTLFFVISGFIMVFTSVGQKQTFSDFIRNRITRVVPLYWLITLTIFTIALVKPTILKSTHADVAELLKSLAFVPFVKESGLVQPLVFVGWTLNYEMFFYCLFALGLLASRRVYGALGIMAVLVVLVLIGSHIAPEMTVVYFFTRPILLEFGFGMGLGLLWLSCPVRSAPSLFVLIVLTCSVGMVLMAPVDLLARANVGYGLASGAIVGTALLLERNRLCIRWAWLQRLGDASYAIYLTHFFVTVSAERLVQRLPPDSILTPIAVVVTLTLCAIVGLAVHDWVEQPLTRATKRLWKIR